MASSEFVFFLTCLLLGKMAQINHLTLSSTVRQDVRFISVNVGDRVTLQCFHDNEATKYYWYKQRVGQKPQLMSIVYKFDKGGNLYNTFKNSSRFTLENNDNVNRLRISDVQLSDSATYYCVRGYSYMFEFEEGVTVSVEGSGVNVQTLVHQGSSENIQPGGSVTLSCTVHTGTCDGEHSVYWFKNSEEHQPGLLYTHGDKRDQCERKPDTQTHTCIYNLSLRSLKSSHAGTYYCAVASCGHILFGNGTKLDFGDKLDCRYLMYFWSAACTLLTVSLVYSLCIIHRRNRNSCRLTDSNVTASKSLSSKTDAKSSENVKDACCYVALSEMKLSTLKREKDNTWSECVYSLVLH